MLDQYFYYSAFINQWATIPNSISKKVNKMYSNEVEGVKHCIKLIITNLLACGEIAYSMDTHFYTANHTKYYTYKNFKKALEIVVNDKYAIKTKRGSKKKGFQKGISSRIKMSGKLEIKFNPSNRNKSKITLNVKSLPFLEV
jgi:hypothetical protein